MLGWLQEEDETRLAELWARADAVRREHVGDAVHLRGLIEISNHCVRHCHYCGLRAPNDRIERYRMTAEEILACAARAVEFGYGTVVLQSGEDPGLTCDFIADVVRAIKDRTPLAVTLSLGERDPDELAAWREAGADRYLLRFETSNRELYERIHPGRKSQNVEKSKSQNPESAIRNSWGRIAMLGTLHELGYEVGSGVMIGIPGQTYDDLADDIALFAELDLDMIGVGPFIAHPATPLGLRIAQSSVLSEVPATEWMTYKVLALARLVCPDANIPATTALATLNKASGRELGLARGANIVMPNLTPPEYRRKYEIYPAKACLYESDADCHACLRHRILGMGRTIGTGRGDARKSQKIEKSKSQNRGGTIRNPRPGGLPAQTLSHGAVDFVDDERLTDLLRNDRPDTARVRDVIARSLAKEPLSAEETAVLLAADDPESVEAVFDAARRLKRDVYGNRIVLFAPLYIGNDCVNDCAYCAFKRSNNDAIRRTLDGDEIRRQVEALENVGHKRLILVFGEHPRYSAEYIADCVRNVYEVRAGRGEIRRVNINAAPMDLEGFRTVKAAGIGTFQVFQETYHHETFARVHPPDTRKGDFLYRLDALSRAQEAGIDDVGIGALFGLYDWRFEVLGLVTHAIHLRERFGVGPHTISFPRIRPAAGVRLDNGHAVSDPDFKRLIAILRLAVPYTGLILTARESASLRREVMEFGVSQIDAGSRIEIGGYTEAGDAQCMEREQFELGDVRSLDAVMRELLTDGYLPSFCTACYRLGRTGEHFMEFAIPGFIQDFCTPNALTTLAEYLADYASPETRAAGQRAIADELARMADGKMKGTVQDRLRRIQKAGERDLCL